MKVSATCYAHLHILGPEFPPLIPISLLLPRGRLGVPQLPDLFSQPSNFLVSISQGVREGKLSILTASLRSIDVR